MLWKTVFAICKFTVIHFYQRIDYYCKLIYTQSSVWSATYYSFNFGSEKYRTTVR